MQESKVYLHPLIGEPFGISTVEAMSSGLIPVVTDVGGHTEFVPSKYQFHTFGQGVEAVSLALMATNSERILISNSVKKYSIESFIDRFQQIVKNVYSNKIKP
jgi:glycosyltransferase involved in cell wall biosynthesis